MSDSALTSGQPLLPHATHRKTDRTLPADRTPSVAVPLSTHASATPARSLLGRYLRTMRGLDLRGFTLDITPAEIGEDLDYGRD